MIVRALVETEAAVVRARLENPPRSIRLRTELWHLPELFLARLSQLLRVPLRQLARAGAA